MDQCIGSTLCTSVQGAHFVLKNRSTVYKYKGSTLYTSEQGAQGVPVFRKAHTVLVNREHTLY